MASKFRFKFLPKSLPKLNSCGNNYPKGNTQSEWDASNNNALVMLISAVYSDLTINMSIALFRNLANLGYKDGNDLCLHLDEFHQQ
ncbi:hypothetical protein CC86DRAFT_414285 [Ophiobolus disseminans]|uniref:Uncharacterized protein n=1 Tax=Ophiobolus disseminans TaxID=1469910 RepID=A0A6A6ZB03_9PLEO|nr:hypothetical protein CC86DRAFT_414285 [Ophiobolus disseminans]